MQPHNSYKPQEDAIAEALPYFETTIDNPRSNV